MPSYVVYKGKVPGVYDDWEEWRKQVYRFSGNSYKGYTTRAEAEARYARYLAGERRERRRNRMKTSFIAMMLIVTAALFYVMVVYLDDIDFVMWRQTRYLVSRPKLVYCLNFVRYFEFGLMWRIVLYMCCLYYVLFLFCAVYCIL